MLKPEDTAGDGSVGAPDRASLARALRDLEATKARVQQNAERVYDEVRRELVLELLPIVDNLDRTVDAAETGSGAALVDGVRMVRAELEGVLVRYGVHRVDAAGQRFDPALHEAVAAIPVADSELVGTVVRQIVPGYRLGSKVLRPAKVGVGVRSSAPGGRSSPFGANGRRWE